MPVTNTVKDGLEGYLSLSLLSVNELVAPAAPTVTPSTTGGTIATGISRWYKVSATNADGETFASPAGTAVSGAGSTNKNTVTWAAVADATGYKVYSATVVGGPFYFKGATTTTTLVDTDGVVTTTNDQPPAWVELGFVTGFNYEENPNDRAVYSHYEVDHYKKGRADASGSISHLYTNRAVSVYKMLDSIAGQNRKSGVKLEVKDDGGSTITETHKLCSCKVGPVRFNSPDSGDITISADLKFRKSYVS